MDINLVKNDINAWLSIYFQGKDGLNKKVYDSMEYSLNIGGKRLRPILMLVTYSMYKSEFKTILPIAGAIEMIHTYSLIHDDLPCMDNDDLRRGNPTNHKVFGDAIAVLAGDGLLNEAMNVMFEYCSSNNKPNIIHACKLISQSAGVNGMIGGQVVDISIEGIKVSKETLEYMHRMKTGALIKAAILSGAILGEASEEDLAYLEKYGEKLGLAFQVEDDILDVIGDEKTLGKPVNSDRDNNKTTFVTIYGIDKCKNICASLTEDCINILKNVSKDTTSLQEITRHLLKRKF